MEYGLGQDDSGSGQARQQSPCQAEQNNYRQDDVIGGGYLPILFVCCRLSAQLVEV